MSRLVLVGAAAVLVVTMLSFAWAATNLTLNSSRSNIYRELPGTTLVSASTPLITTAVPQLVYTTPPTGDFVLTQFCASPTFSGIRLAATGLVGLGDIAHTTTSILCYTFQPGLIMPKAAQITCTTTEFAQNGFCMIAGLLRP
jgi:hypothetical protein